MEKKELDPFAGDSVSVAMSNGQRKLGVKIAHDRGIKKLREKPDSYQNLMKTIGFQAKDPSACNATYQVEYTDEQGDVIAVSDDEDLAAAYEWAEMQPTMNLKLTVRERKSAQAKALEKEIETKITQPLQDLKLNDQSSSDSSDEDKPKSDQKSLRKDKKLMRKMVRKQMKLQSKELIKSIMVEETSRLNAPESVTVGDKADNDQIDTEAVKDKEDLNQSVHPYVECDICGVAPIRGTRYKCTVRKNYDLCSKCEASKEHPYAFLAIKAPSQAPKAMYTIINEDMPTSQEVDGDIHVDDMKKRFGKGRCGGPWKCGKGKGFGGHKMDPDQFAAKMEKWGKCMGDWGKKMADEEKQNPGAFDKKMEGWADCMTKFGQKMAEEHKNGNQTPCGEFAGMDPHIMKQKVAWFMKNMMGAGPHHHGPHHFGGHHNLNGRKNPNRAVPVSFPTKQYSVCAGDYVNLEVTFENKVPFPYKEGFHLENVEGAINFVEPIKVSVPEVEGRTQYTVQVPVKISESTQSCIRNEVPYYDLELGITNKNGMPVGQTCKVQFRVIEKIDDLALCDLIQQLDTFTQSACITESQAPFEESVALLKEADYNVEKAIDMILQKRQEKVDLHSSQFDKVNDEADDMYD